MAEVSSEIHVAQQMDSPELEKVGDGYAISLIDRMQVINGEQLNIVYDVDFAQDEDGLWRIDRY